MKSCRKAKMGCPRKWGVQFGGDSDLQKTVRGKNFSPVLQKTPMYGEVFCKTALLSGFARLEGNSPLLRFKTGG
jgi:hypothetical protein